MPSTLRSSQRRGPHSRNPGRRDGFRWNSNGFICPASVDGFRRDPRDATAAAPYEDCTAADLEERGSRVCLKTSAEHEQLLVLPLPRHEVALMDIARYAKLKGVAKEFEVLDAPRRVIVLDEDAFVHVDGLDDDSDDSEWEDITDFDSGLDAGPSTTTRDYFPSDDYLLARRLQDEEYARAGVRRPTSASVHGVSGAWRREYADVLAASNAAG
ncbi:hypothetical protein K438DRAFT_1880395 [Mycena galopus ATCC 62051]|nr:hypothetical protein K438DRAFT_1880395 [Mycena galopus ATCC 62051]